MNLNFLRKVSIYTFVFLLCNYSFFKAQTWGTQSWFTGWYGDPCPTPTAAADAYSNPNIFVGDIQFQGGGQSLACAGSTSYFQYTTTAATNFATAVTAGRYFYANITIKPNSPLLRLSGVAGNVGAATGTYTYGVNVVDLSSNTVITAANSLTPGTTTSTLTTPVVMYPGKTYQIRWYLWTGTAGQTRGMDNPALYFQVPTNCATSPTISGNSELILGGATSILAGSGTPDATNPWQSSNTSIVTVSNTGVLTPVAKGSATITYLNSTGCTAVRNVYVDTDFDKDGKLDSYDYDNDNDGILDATECGLTEITPGANNTWSDGANGYSLFSIGGLTDGLGWQKSGFQREATRRGLGVVNLNTANDFTVTGSIATFNNGTVTLSYSPGTDPTTITKTTTNELISGATGDGLFVNYTNTSVSAGYLQDLTVKFTTPVYGFSFDLVDMYDTTLPSTAIMKKEIFVNNISIGYYQNTFLGDNLTGNITFTPSSGSSFTQLAGNNTENSIGIISKGLINNVVIRTTYVSGANLYRDPFGLDNFTYTTECSTDTDTDGIFNSFDFDSDGDGCFDSIEGAGTVTLSNINSNGSISGAVDANGIPTFIGTSGQGLGTSANSSMSACFINVNNDINQVPSGITGTGNILGNDYGTTGLVQSATFYNSTGTLTALTLGSATPIYTSTGTLAGTLTLNTNGSYSFVPASGFIGNAPVNYTVANSSGVTATAILSLRVRKGISTFQNDSPIAQNDTAGTKTGFNLSSTVLNNDSDPDGDALTITSASVTIGTATQLSGVDSNGNTVANAGTITLNSNGNYTFVPATGFTGVVNTVSYTISDGKGGTDSATLSILVNPNLGNTIFVNDDASANPKGTAMTGNVLTNDTDPENNTITLSSASANGTSLTIGSANTISGVGTFTISSTGVYTFTPLSTYVGTTPIQYTACDNGVPQACKTATLYLTSLPWDVCTKAGNTTGTPIVFGKTGVSQLNKHLSTNWPNTVPHSVLSVESLSRGMVITRMNSPETDISAPVEGMIIFDIDDNCLKLYTTALGWHCITQSCK